MDEILNQLGRLALGAVPTMLFFILLVIAYGLLVRGPLDRVLAERRARTTGAVEQARAAISDAEAKTADYEDRMRRARGRDTCRAGEAAEAMEHGTRACPGRGACGNRGKGEGGQG
jgi:hypothetical protein